MRKILLGASLMLFSMFSFGQSVVDNAVIPVSVTLNSILRLSVTSGGNIQFVVNTIADYTGGILNSDQYDTRFTVHSSRNFDVTMGAEDANLIGLETGSNMPLTNLRYTMAGSAGPGFIAGTNDLAVLPGVAIVTANAGGNLAYIINWELGTGAATLLSQNLPADIYVTNVFLNLAPQ